jgi:SET domain-containing protein
MMLIKTYLQESGIHGIGVYAGEPIPKGTKIWEFMEGLDPIYDASLLQTMPEPTRSFLNRYTYPHHTLPGKIVLDGDHGRFMNHSDTPNTDFTAVPCTVGYALCDIAQGEELTCNYNEFAPGFVLD